MVFMGLALWVGFAGPVVKTVNRSQLYFAYILYIQRIFLGFTLL